MKTLFAHEILKMYFHRKKLTNSLYSLRSWARDIKISPGFASEMLSGKRPIPASRIAAIVTSLQMDFIAEELLKKAIVKAKLKKEGLPTSALEDTRREFDKLRHLEAYEPLEKKKFSILNPWYNVVILDLLSCTQFQDDLKWIANTVGISEFQAKWALDELLNQGFIKRDTKGLHKVSRRLRLALQESHPEIRTFHLHMIEKAKQHLQRQTTQADFKLREISGICLAANPENIPEAKIKLAEALHEVVEILTQGPCTQVYSLAVQLIPLLKQVESEKI